MHKVNSLLPLLLLSAQIHPNSRALDPTKQWSRLPNWVHTDRACVGSNGVWNKTETEKATPRPLLSERACFSPPSSTLLEDSGHPSWLASSRIIAPASYFSHPLVRKWLLTIDSSCRSYWFDPTGQVGDARESKLHKCGEDLWAMATEFRICHTESSFATQSS